MNTAITRGYLITTLFIAIGLLVLSEQVVGASDYMDRNEVFNKETSLYVRGAYFQWEEFDDDGTRLLRESGPIVGVGISGKSNMTDTVSINVNVELFGGIVDYDGQTQGGVPSQTDTSYIGAKGVLDIGVMMTATGKSYLEPFVGIGVRWWERDIKSTPAALGYLETWSSYYARMGIRGDHSTSEHLRVFIEGGAKYPLLTKNRADLSVIGFSDVTLESGGGELSLFAEAGIKGKNLFTTIFYEGQRFPKSDVEVVGPFLVWQPESKADIFGLNLGLLF